LKTGWIPRNGGGISCLLDGGGFCSFFFGEDGVYDGASAGAYFVAGKGGDGGRLGVRLGCGRGSGHGDWRIGKICDLRRGKGKREWERPSLLFRHLDPASLRIARIASAQATSANLPSIRPLCWAYRALLSHPQLAEPPKSDNAQTEEIHPEGIDLEWLENQEIIAAARHLFRRNLRLAQEHIGWNHMRDQTKINFDESAFR